MSSPSDQAALLARFDRVDSTLAGLATRLTAIEGKLVAIQQATAQPEPAEVEPINFATGAALEEVRKLASSTELIAMRILNGESLARA